MDNQGQDDRYRRGQSFGFRAGFLLSVASFALNIDSLLRFPHFCMFNGGAAFFIPYTIAMIVLGLSSVYLEMLIGQISMQGPLQAWNKLLPPMKGLGFLYCLFALFTMAYYFPIMSYALYYFYLVATYAINISTCSNAWNTINCTLSYNYSCLPNITLPFINMTTNITTTTAPTTEVTTMMTSTLMANMSNITTTISMPTPLSPLTTCPQYHSLLSNLPEAEFFRNFAFEGPPTTGQLGSLVPSLVACSLIAWCFTYIAVVVGLRSFRWFAFIITVGVFSLIVMMIIVVQDLDGARDGILYLTTPHYNYLLRPSTWAVAGLQALWTLSLGYGSYAHFGYRNKANTNPFWQALITVAVVEFFQFLVAYCVFAYIGFIGKQSNQFRFVMQHLDQGIGLLFIILPTFVKYAPAMVHWLSFFYIVFVMMAVGTQAILLETVSTIIHDELPRKIRSYKWPLRVIISYIVLGFSCFSEIQGGYHIVTAMGKVIQDWSLIMVILQSITLAYIFGMGTRIESNMAKYNRPRMLIFWIIISVITALFSILLFIYYQVYNVTINQPSDLAMAKTMFYVILGVISSVLLAVLICKLLGIGEGSSTQEDNQLNLDVGFEKYFTPRRRDTGAQRLMPHRES